MKRPALTRLLAQDKKQSPFVEAFFWGTMYIIFILLTALLAGCGSKPETKYYRILIGDDYAHMNEDSSWVINDAEKAIALLLAIPDQCEITTKHLNKPNPCNASHYIVNSHGEIQAIRTDSLGQTWWVVRNAEYALEAMYSAEIRILSGDTTVLSYFSCK